MNPNPAYANFEINGEKFELSTPVDGIALTPDGEYIFYTPLTGKLVYRIPTVAAKVVNKNKIFLICMWEAFSLT